jgi:acyl-CoA thioesterase-1
VAGWRLKVDMARTTTRTPPKPAPRRFALTPAQWAIAAALLLSLTWGFWPSRYSKVKNLDARGSTIVAFGDSLTEGFGAGPGEDYPSRLAKMIATPVTNAGVSGDTTESALARLDEVLALHPRVVIVGLGGNDFLRRTPIAVTAANLRTIVKRTQANGAMVVLLGFRFPSIGGDYDALYESIADDEGCLLIPDMLDGILRNPKLKSDEIHPNAAGYELMAERIAPSLAKLLARADAAR